MKDSDVSMQRKNQNAMNKSYNDMSDRANTPKAPTSMKGEKSRGKAYTPILKNLK